MAELIEQFQKRINLDSIRLLRPAMILAVLAGSFILGRMASRNLLMLLVLGIGALVLLRKPMLIIFPLVIGTMIVGYEIGTGTQSAINVTILITIAMIGLWALDLLVEQRRFYNYPSRVNPPLLALCLMALISFIAGQLPWFAFARPVSIAAQIAGLSLFILSAGAFLWVSQSIQDLKWLRWLVWLYLGAGAIFILGNFLPIGFVSNLIEPSATGSLFWVWMVALAGSQALINKKLNSNWRILMAILAALALTRGWINREWVSGWLPAAIGFWVILMLWNWRWGFVTGVVSGLVALVFNPAILQRLLEIDQYSIYTRQEAWRIVLNNIVKISPLIGLGPANYYNYTPLFPILGYAIRFNSHNQYVDLIAQIGFIGLFIFIWLMTEIGWLGWRLKDRFAPGFEKAYVIGALGGLAGTLAAGMFGDWFIPFVYNIGLEGFRTSVFGWIFLGGLVAIERLASVPNEGTPEGS
jgi:O-antigen ligase